MEPGDAERNGLSDEAAGEVAAMQFAGGRSVAEVAAAWERDAAWVEAAVRRALRTHIPRRDGGLKETRAELRGERRDERDAVMCAQRSLEW